MSLLALWSPAQVFSVLVLVLGFGFVIFFHELGHFLAAKWVGIKVEQFAVGFGQALVSWRKGVGFRIGNTQKDYQQKLDQYVDTKYKDNSQVMEKSGIAYQDALIEAEKSMALGETEYRLNWIPLGGYVKMLGQDDLRPNAEAADPRSYNNKSIPARMLVVSAGVIMNIMLAGIGFMLLFMIGFHVPPAWVGNIVSDSPAQNTTTPDGQRKPLQVGDQILDYDGKPQEDFTKIGLNVALSAENAKIPIHVKHLDGSIEPLQITPIADENGAGFLSIGITAPRTLRGLDLKDFTVEPNWQQLAPPDARAVLPGETITAINGEPVKPEDYWKLDQAVQSADGKPVRLTVKDDATGKSDVRLVQPHFEPLFGKQPLSFAGMMPRPAILGVVSGSSALGRVLPGDVVQSIAIGRDVIEAPTSDELRDHLSQAGNAGQAVTLVVVRNGKTLSVEGLTPNLKVDPDKGRRGLGVQLMYDEMNPIVAGVVKGSPADLAHLRNGDRITAINGHEVANWFDVRRQMLASPPGDVTVSYTDAAGKQETKIALTADQLTHLGGMRCSTYVELGEYIITRKASNPAQAIKWGITETRDFILQFYLTLRRMVGGSVSPNQLMGPVGIFVNGAKFAFRGWDWLLWFLSMISANLAVVNFLPIPIVDGGLFTFLILEKIQGRPLSPRAQAIAQYVGLAFLAGVFLFVTYHDIVRFIPNPFG